MIIGVVFCFSSSKNASSMNEVQISRMHTPHILSKIRVTTSWDFLIFSSSKSKNPPLEKALPRPTGGLRKMATFTAKVCHATLQNGDEPFYFFAHIHGHGRMATFPNFFEEFSFRISLKDRLAKLEITIRKFAI